LTNPPHIMKYKQRNKNESQFEEWGDGNMTFNVYFVDTNGEIFDEMGAMTITEAREFIAMIEETQLDGYEYNDHWFSIKEKAFYIEVV
jgi:hypothetical protein